MKLRTCAIASVGLLYVCVLASLALPLAAQSAQEDKFGHVRAAGVLIDGLSAAQARQRLTRVLDKKLILAFSSQNMGSNLAVGRSYAPMPLTFKGALGWHASHELSLELNYEHQPYDFLNKYRLGGEYAFDLGDESHAAFRAGYLMGPENASGGLSGFSAGLGASWHAWHVDYAFVPKGDLGPRCWSAALASPTP